MKYLLSLTLTIVYILFGNELGYTQTSAWYTHITYMFQHANLWHLSVNILSLITVWISLQRHAKSIQILPMFIVGILASFLPYASFELPTVGISGVIYAMLGMLTVLSTSIREKVMLSVFAILTITAGLITKNVNVALHAYCYIFGVIYMFLYVVIILNKYAKNVE